MVARTRLSAADVVTEREFQATVIEMARAFGWRVYHTHDSRRSDPGFPDLTMARKGRILFMELKAEKGKPTEAQLDWLLALRSSFSVNVHVALYRPSDMPRIVELLT